MLGGGRVDSVIVSVLTILLLFANFFFFFLF